ncbi:MAG: hypothetical protein KGR98_06780 [Verrucomicrobia bacterium]|nr:hypothetical protein [Verrucomicrobiota bacterium]MDE3099717.1 hypothetical protein [Verrucomicrobiota bacterium]
MNEHDHPHSPAAPDVQDADTQALSDALRSSFTIVKFLMAVMMIAFFASGFFIVGPSEKAIVLRFGKPVGQGRNVLLGPGWHWSFPYPIDSVIHIPISERQMVQSTTGWYYETAAEEAAGTPPSAGNGLDPARDGCVITADRDIIHSRATLYYHIDDPVAYIFKFVSASNAVQNMLDNALLQTAAHFKVDDALYTDQAGFQDAVQRRVGDLAEAAGLGIVVDSCNVANVPPLQLAAIFSQVTETREQRNTTIYDARSDAEKTLANAGAKAAGAVDAAYSAQTNYLTRIFADANTFTKLQPYYKANASLFAQEILVPAMGEVLTNVEDTIFLPPRADGSARQLRLIINRELPPPKPAAGS